MQTVDKEREGMSEEGWGGVGREMRGEEEG